MDSSIPGTKHKNGADIVYSHCKHMLASFTMIIFLEDRMQSELLSAKFPNCLALFPARCLVILLHRTQIICLKGRNKVCHVVFLLTKRAAGKTRKDH